MVDRVKQIVATLPELTDVTGVCEVADRRLAEGDAAFVAELGIALADKDGSGAGQVWQYESVFDHLVRMLAITPGQKNVERALRLVAAAGSGGPKRDRWVASMLAFGQPPEDLAVVFAGGGAPGGASEELRACLVQELVLRGVAVTEVPGIARWAGSPHWRHHRLGWLPLGLSGVEEAQHLPHYSAWSSAYSGSFGPSEGPGLLRDRALTPCVPAARETTTSSMASAMTVAVAGWAGESKRAYRGQGLRPFRASGCAGGSGHAGVGP